MTEKSPESAQTLDLLDKDFKSKDLNEIMDKELKETSRIMNEQLKNISGAIDIIKRNEMEILKLKSTIAEMKNLLERFSSKFEKAKERKLEDRNIEIESRSRKIKKE